MRFAHSGEPAIEPFFRKLPGRGTEACQARIANACRAHGLRPVDGAFTDDKDADGYRACTQRAAALGLEGTRVIHPRQLALANEVFSPTIGQIAWATRIRALIERTTQAADGAVGDDGMAVDMAYLKIADALPARQRLVEGRG